MIDGLAQLARLVGVVDHWIDASGYRHEVAADTLVDILSAMDVACENAQQIRQSTAQIVEMRRRPPALLTTWSGVPTRLTFVLPSPAPFTLTYEDGAVVEGHVYDQDGGRWLPPVLHSGYHTLQFGDVRIGLAVAPLRACALVDRAPSRPRSWGLSLDQGDADFGSIALIARSTAGYGADAVAVGALSASNRHWLDTSRVDPGQTFGPHGLMPSLAGADDPSADRLQRLYREALPRDELLLREFLRFSRDGGAALQAHARYEACTAMPGLTSQASPNLDIVSARASAIGDDGDLAEAIGYRIFLQWLAARGKAASQAAARAAGMSIGLIADLDWGASSQGSEQSSTPDRFLATLRAADPDHAVGSHAGADSGISFHPLRLLEQGYQPWIALLRSTMKGVGGIRLPRFDRWQRAWLQPRDGAGGGAYVEQPFDDLLRLLVLESVRQRCVVIVDATSALLDPWREAVEQAGLLSSETLLQQGVDGRWKLAAEFPQRGVAVSSSRVTPSLLDWWQGFDIQQRRERGDVSPLIAARELQLRDHERASLLADLGLERRQSARGRQEVTVRPAHAIARRQATAEQEHQEVRLIDAMITKLARTPNALTLVALNELLIDQPMPQFGVAMEAGALTHLLDAGTVRNRLQRLDHARSDELVRQPAPRRADSDFE